MRLTRLAIAGFGRLRDLELDLAPGMNLVCAPNEAGKSTLAEFVLGALYGFGPRSGGVHPFDPWWGGGDTGGELAYDLADGRAFTLTRHLLKSRQRIALVDHQGREVERGAAEPGELHLGLSRGVFLTVSRITLDDLRGAFSGTAPKEVKEAQAGLRGYFFLEAATRGQVANPVEVREIWSREAAALYSKDRRSGKADQNLNDELAEAEAALEQARRDEAEARGLRDEGERLAREEAAAAARRAQAGKTLEAARLRRDQARDQARRRELQAQAAALAAQGLAGEAVEQSARDLTQAGRRAEEAAAAARRAAAQARSGMPSTQPDRPWEQAATEVERLARTWDLLVSSGEDLGRRRREWQAAVGELEAAGGLDLAELAGLAESLAWDLGRRQDQWRAAQEGAGAARAELADLAPGRMAAGRAWDLSGLAVGAALGLGLWGLLHEALWAGLTGGALLLAGAYLGSLARREEAAALRRAELAATITAAEEAQAALTRDLAPLGLAPGELEPSRLAGRRTRAVELLAEEARIAQAAAEREKKGQALSAALTDLGWAPGDDPGAALERAAGECRQALAALAEAARQEERASAAADEAAAAQKGLAGLLSAQGLPDLAALAAARQRAKEVARLEAQRAEVEARLAGAPDDLPTPEAAQEALEAAARAAQAAQEALDAAGRERARVAEALRNLARRPTRAAAQARLEALEAERKALAERHGVYLLAGALLERAMEAFRLAAQPSLLQGAAGYLQEATAGAYDWLGSDLFQPAGGPEPSLTARSGPGAQPREAPSLSRGTRDQLYLCLRLALADEICRGGEPAPLILDDPLVNFDRARLEGTLTMLADLSRRRQVILLTCHPAQADILAQAGPLQRLELPAP